MGIESVLASIDYEISRLQRARVLLAGSSVNGGLVKGKKRGRKPGKKRKLTPEGRARIAAAVKARWARQKAASRK